MLPHTRKQVAAALILGVVFAVVDLEFLYVRFVWPVARFVGITSVRLTLRLILFGIVPVLLTIHQRNKAQAAYKMVMERRTELMQWLSVKWHRLPRWAQKPLIGVGAVCSLALFLAFSFFPMRSEAAVFASGAVRRRVTPVAARFAIARGILRWLPVAWVELPRRIREKVATQWPIVKRRSVRRIIKSRRASGRFFRRTFRRGRWREAALKTVQVSRGAS